MKAKRSLSLRILAFALCLLMAVPALAEDWRATGGPADDYAAENGEDGAGRATIQTIYTSAQAVGTVTNMDAPTSEGGDATVFAFTPLEVALGLDESGSMADANPNTGETRLDYAQEASRVFADTLFSINPGSRVGVVGYSDSAHTISSLRGLSDKGQVVNAINSTSYYGSTNTGGGFAEAKSLLDTESMPGRRRVVLLLSDGWANVGVGDPAQYAVRMGQETAESSLVYTIGLVGGMDKSDLNYTRRVLNAGYETRYYEVDYRSTENISARLASLFVEIAVCGGAQDDTTTYQLNMGPGMNVQVLPESGAVLSSEPANYNTNTGYGFMADMGEGKVLVLSEGNYRILLHGVDTRKSGLTLNMITGSKITPAIDLENFYSYPRFCGIIDIVDGIATLTVLPYEPLDVNALDPFTGVPTMGTQKCALAQLKGNQPVQSYPDGNAAKVGAVNKSGYVLALAQDAASGYTLIAFSNDDHTLSRGWVKTAALAVQGYVPNMVWLSGDYALSADANAYYAPDQRAALAGLLPAGTEVSLLAVERDEAGTEWAYVRTKLNKKAMNLYVPASAIADWTPLAPAIFRIGYEHEWFCYHLDFTAISTPRGQRWSVYASPTTNSWRGANGKACVSTNDIVWAIGWGDNDGLLLMYDISATQYRMGYSQAADIVQYSELMPMYFDRRDAVISSECVLTDDPVYASSTLCNLAVDTKVTYLAAMSYGGNDWAYIETKASGKPARGLVPSWCISLVP